MTSFLNRTDGDARRRLAYAVRGAGPLVITVPGMGDLRSADDALAEALISDGFRMPDDVDASYERLLDVIWAGFAALGEASPE
jgi:hypothetical protein